MPHRAFLEQGLGEVYDYFVTAAGSAASSGGHGVSSETDHLGERRVGERGVHGKLD
jgi:hypothetical protein